MVNIVLKLAWRNLWRHPRRTWLTTGAMIFSNVLLVFMISLEFGMYGLMIDNSLRPLTGHMQVQAPGYIDDKRIRQVVPQAAHLAATLRDALGTDAVAARGAAFALASSKDRSFGIQLLGIQPGYEAKVSNIPGLITSGRFLRDDDTGSIVVGSVLARNLRVGTGDEITLIGSGRDGSFAAGIVTVVGIFDSGVADIDRSIAELPLGFFQDTFFMQDAAHEIVIDAGDVSQTDEVLARVQTLLQDHPPLVVHDWNELVPGLRQAIQADISSAFFMYGVLVILVAFSVLNTQLMSVLERTREFGIVLSLGLTPGKLGRLIMLETGLMGLLGLLIGTLLGTLLTLWFSVNGFAMPGMEEMGARFNLPARFYPQLQVVTIIAGPAVVYLFSLMASLYPALRLYWLEPVQAMRAA